MLGDCKFEPPIKKVLPKVSLRDALVQHRVKTERRLHQ